MLLPIEDYTQLACNRGRQASDKFRSAAKAANGDVDIPSILTQAVAIEPKDSRKIGEPRPAMAVQCEAGIAGAMRGVVARINDGNRSLKTFCKIPLDLFPPEDELVGERNALLRSNRHRTSLS